MSLLPRLFSVQGSRSRQQVAERAARVIDNVIFDLGVGRLVQGTVQLDGRLRPHFFADASRKTGGMLAHVPLAALAEAAAFDPCAQPGDGAALRDASAALVQGLLREFGAQSPRFRALPA